MRKDDAVVEACGAADEAQSSIGLARAHGRASGQDELDALLIGVERDLWVLMAELATGDEHAASLVDGESRVTAGMVSALETTIDAVTARFEPAREFVVPGQTVVAAALDVARTVVRRAERRALAVARDGSFVVPYLNRLSDLLWTLARWQDVGSLPARADPPEERP